MEFLPLLLAFLAPVAAYCTALAVINRRPHPVPVRGAWDFAALLFAVSGLLLVIVPTLINRYFEGAVLDLALEGAEPSQDSLDGLVTLWWLVWAGYHLLLVVAATLLVWARRGKTVVYNVSAHDFGEALDRALDRVRFTSARSGDSVVLSSGTPAGASPQLATAVTAGAPVSAGPPASAEFRVETFPALWNVTLHWADPAAPPRREVEAELRAALADVASDDNPVGGWLMGVSGFLLALVFLTGMGLVLTQFFPMKQ